MKPKPTQTRRVLTLSEKSYETLFNLFGSQAVFQMPRSERLAVEALQEDLREVATPFVEVEITDLD